MLHQSWTSFSSEEQTHGFDAHLGFDLSDLQESSNPTISSVALGIASRVGGRVGDAVDYLQALHSDRGILPHDSSETQHETSPSDWKQYITVQMNRIGVDRLLSVPRTGTSSDATTTDGYCKELHELPV